MHDAPDVLRSEFADDPDMRELVELFVREMPQRAESLEAAWSGGRADELRRLAHQLRGASAGYGFAALGTQAGRVEDLLRSADPSSVLGGVREQVDELVRLCRSVSV